MKNLKHIIIFLYLVLTFNLAKSYSESKVEIINPEFLCEHKNRTKLILESVVNGLTCFVNGDIKSMELFLSPDCQEVIKSQKKIYKGRKQVLDHIVDIIKNNQHKQCQLTKFEIVDPCTIFSKDQVVVSFVGIERYVTKNKKNVQYKSHITLVLSKDLTIKQNTNSANPYSDYRCILFQMDGWKKFKS